LPGKEERGGSEEFVVERLEFRFRGDLANAEIEEDNHLFLPKIGSLACVIVAFGSVSVLPQPIRI